MRRLVICLIFTGLFAGVSSLSAATGQVMKVLPQFLDLQGRTTLSPSLYERDAYQVVLRDHPAQRSGIKYCIQWKTKGYPWDPLRLKLELRGTAQGDLPRSLVLEKNVTPGGWFSNWADFTLSGAQYKSFGAVTAWRVTLWEGDRLLGEQKSFLW